MPVITDGQGRSFLDDGSGTLFPVQPMPPIPDNVDPQTGSAGVPPPMTTNQPETPPNNLVRPEPPIPAMPGSSAMVTPSAARQMIEQGLIQRAQKEAGSKFQRFGQALAGLSPNLNQEKLLAYQQDQEKQQEGMMKLLVDIASKTASIDDPEERDRLRKTTAPILYHVAKQLGVDITPGMADAAVSEPDAAQKMAGLASDPLMSDQAKYDYNKLLKTKAAFKNGGTVLSITNGFIKQVADGIRSGTVNVNGQTMPFSDFMVAAADEVRKNRAPGAQPAEMMPNEISAGELRSFLAKQPLYAQSRVAREAVDSWIKDSGREYGVISGPELTTRSNEVIKGQVRKTPDEEATSIYGQQAMGTAGLLFPAIAPSAAIADPAKRQAILAANKLGEEAKGIFMDQWAKAGNPTDPKQIAQLVGTAEEKVRQNKVLTAGQSGASRVILEQRAKQEMPYQETQSYMGGAVYVNKKTLQEADMSQPADVLNKDPNVKLLRPNDAKAVRDIRATTVHFNMWDNVIKQMPDGVFGKADAAKAWIADKLGEPNWVTAMNALEGTIQNMSRTLQGSAQNLSDADLNIARKMFPSMWKSKSQAELVIRSSRAIIDANRAALMGDITAPERDAKLNQIYNNFQKAEKLDTTKYRIEK